MAEQKKGKHKYTSRWQRVAWMDREVLDFEGAADVLGVSKITVYKLAREAAYHQPTLAGNGISPAPISLMNRERFRSRSTRQGTAQRQDRASEIIVTCQEIPDIWVCKPESIDDV